MLAKKFFMLVSIVSFAIFFTNVDVYADIEASLWVPEKVLLKEEYFAMIVLDSDLNSDIVFDIVTDNEEILMVLTEEIIISDGMHHGLIKFETIGTGNAKLYAIANGILLEERIDIVESAANPTNLDLILPSDLVNVLVDENVHTGYVFLLNDFKNTVTTKTPISIILTSNGDIELLEKSVTIEPGKHYTKFQFRASDEGSISASSPNLLPDEENISFEESEEIELIIAVGPDPIPTSSTAEIYFWLERDGDPYLAPHNVQITISIDKSANLSFDSAMRGSFVLSESNTDKFGRDIPEDVKKILTKSGGELTRDSKETFVLKKGEHYGKLQAYTSFDSAGNIKISGTAESIDINNEDEEEIRVSEVFTTSTEKSNDDIVATKTKVFAYPDPAYKEVEIIISSSSDKGPVIEDDNADYTLFTDNKLQLPSELQFKIQVDKNYSIIKAKIIDIGTTKIFAQMQEAESDEIEIDISGKYVKNPELDIVILPVLFNTEQDLFLVSSSQDKIVTHADEKGNLISITSRPTFDFKVIQESESVITITGKVTDILENDPEVHVSSNAFTVKDTLEIYNPERKKLDSLHPTFVYPREPFPIVKYMNDLNDNPVKKANLNVSSNAEIGTINELYFFNQTGTHDIIFYDKNSVPIKSTITVKGSEQSINKLDTEKNTRPTVFTYEIIVHNALGGGMYEEGKDVTISAPLIKDDIFILKKKLVGWENLPYKESEINFEADEDLETRPIYQDDFTVLYVIVGVAVGLMSIIVIKQKRKGKQNTRKSSSNEDDDILEMLKD